MGKHTIKRKPPVQRSCLNCGVDFIAQNNEVAKGRGLFCSAECRGKSQSKPLPSGGQSLKCCVVCEQGFIVRRKTQRTCSQECGSNLKKQNSAMQRAPA